MNILVTGVTGYLGAASCRRFSATGTPSAGLPATGDG